MCKICKKPTIKLQVGKLFYYQCSFCGFLEKSSEHHLSEEKEYQRYLQHDNNINDGYLRYQKTFLEQIRQHLGTKVLDFGCGESHLLASLIGCTYYDKYFYPNQDIYCNWYDTIIMEEVIEHLYDPVEELTRLDKLLIRGGKLVIRTQFLKDNTNLSEWWYLRDQTHISFFQTKTFNVICELFNYRIIYCNDFDLIILQKA